MEPKNPMSKGKRPWLNNPRVHGTYSQPNIGPGKFGTSWDNFSCAKAALTRGVPVLINESNALIEDIAETLDGDEVTPGE